MFRGYPALENEKQFRKDSEKHDSDVIVTEKIHGCNLAFILQQDQPIKVQSRNKILEPGENFYAYQTVLVAYSQKLSSLCSELCGSKADMVHVFGEMFGGHYPGSPKVDGVKLIQPRLYYCPGNDFAVFNILVNNRWLTYDETCKLCATHGLRVVPCLARCKLSELDLELKKWAEFPTRIPSLFYKLPELKDNFAEGIVARVVTADGSLGRMLKLKNRKFQERAFKLTDAQKKERENQQQKTRRLKALSQGYITETRIEAHLSKYGPGHKEAAELVAQDAHQDLLLDEPGADIGLRAFLGFTRLKIEGLLKRALQGHDA